MATFFDDIGKDFDDLRSKGFPNNGTFKVSSESKTQDGVTFVTNFTKVTKEKAASVEASFEPKFSTKLGELNVELEDKLSTTGKYSVKATFKDLLTKGLKVAPDFGNDGKSWRAGLTTSFANDLLALKLALGAPLAGNPISVSSSLAVAYPEDVNFGAAVNLKTESGKDLAYTWAAKAGFKRPDFQVNLNASSGDFGKNQLLLGAGWFQKISANLKLGVGAGIDVQAVDGPRVYAVSDYKFDELSSLKSKAEFTTYPNDKPADLRLGFGLKQQVSTNLTATFGGDLNAWQLLQTDAAGAGHSFGVELKFQ